MSTLSAEELELLGEMPPEESPADPTPAISSTPASLPRSGSKSGYEAIVFDIETGPLPDDELFARVGKFDPASIQPFPAFDESSVKYGNLKEEKRAEKLKACIDQHALDKIAHDAKNATAEADYIAGVKSKAALDAKTGRVLAIGYYFTEDQSTDIEYIGYAPGNIPPARDEAAVIRDFWGYVEAAPEHCRIVGHNIAGFDLPFLIQRSWILGIEVPRGVIEGRFFAKKFADTMQVWACGKVGNGSMAKLDDLAKVFGVGSKTGNGAMFAELFEKDRAAAIEYLKNDVAITYAVAKRMGVCK